MRRFEYKIDSIVSDGCVSLYWDKHGCSCKNLAHEDAEKCERCRKELKAWLLSDVPVCKYVGAFCHEEYNCEDCTIGKLVAEYVEKTQDDQKRD